MNTNATRKDIIRKNTRSLAVWTLLWLITMALISFGWKLIWDENDMISLLLILVNALIGAGMILANIRYIKALDELDRKITLDALALALGFGVVGGLSYSLLDITNVITFDAEISILVIIISLTYLGGIVIGKFRYQ